jgi:hypothetical protein
MASASLIINERPLSQWIIDLASGDSALRRAAGLALYCFHYDIDDPDEMSRNDDLQRLASAPNDNLLTAAVSEAFAQDDFPVGAVVAGLADYLIGANQAGLDALCGDGDDTVIDDMLTRSKVFGIAAMILLHAGPAAAAGIPSLIRMLTAQAECGIVSSNVPALTAANALHNMGAAAAPAFDALFDVFAEDGDDPMVQALATIAGAVPELQSRLLGLAQDSDEDRRWAALEILYAQGDASDATKAAAIAAVSSRDDDIRHSAACILRRHFLDDPDAAAAMKQARDIEWEEPGDDDDDLLVAESPFERKGQPLAHWIKQLAFGNKAEQQEAHDCISAMEQGLVDVHMDIEIQVWEDVDSDEFHAAIRDAMSSSGFPTEDVLRVLISRLTEVRARVNKRSEDLFKASEDELAEWTTLSFAQISLEAVIENCGAAGAPALDAIEALFSRGEDSRSLSGTAATALGSMGAAALPAFDPLLRSAGEWYGMQCPCPWRLALANIARNSDDAVDRLVHNLSASEQGVRKAAALALADAVPAHPAALAAAADRLAAAPECAPEELVRFVAVSCGESAIARDWIVDWIWHPDAGVRGTVASALEHFPDTGNAAAHLSSMAEDDNPFVRSCVLRAQCTLEISDDEKVGCCMKRIDDWAGHDDWVPAENALCFLTNVGSAAAPAVPALIAAVQRQERCIDDIMEVLHNVGPEAGPAVPLLKTRLEQQLEWDPLMENDETVRLDTLIKALQK